MLYFRDDDVLVRSSGHKSSLKKFQQVHRWISVNESLMHVPTILVTEIQEFPDAIKYIFKETKEGRMLPQLHGLEHKDYNKLTLEEIKSELHQAKEWMISNLEVTPTQFMTPWGANSDKIQEASRQVDLKVIDCSRKLSPKEVLNHLRRGLDPKHFDNQMIMFHWWEGSLRVPRIVSCWIHGGYENSKFADPKLYGEET